MIKKASLQKIFIVLLLLVVIDEYSYSQCTLPVRPANSGATLVTCSGFTASWELVSGATSYRLDVSTTSTFSSMVSGYNDLVVSGNSRAVTGLTPGFYYTRVRAVDGCGISASSSLRTIGIGSIGGVTRSAVSGSAVSLVCGTDYGSTLISDHNGSVIRWERSYDNINWSTIVGGSATTCCLTGDSLRIRAIINKSGCGEVASSVTTYVRKTAEFVYSQNPYCNWNSSNNPSIKVSNPVPTFINGGVRGSFSATPGLVFVSTTTGEVNLQASAAGSYTVTNTVSSGCSLSSTANLTIRPGLSITIEEKVFNSPVPMGYYLIAEAATNPDLRDDTKYKISWSHITSSGEIKPATDLGARWESVAKSNFRNFIIANPSTGTTRSSDALCVDVLNKTTGCITRKCAGKDPSTLPSPGSGFRAESLAQEQAEERVWGAGIQIYPNPAQSTLHVELQGEDSFKAELRSMNGVLISTHQSEGGTTTIDVSNLASGLYLLYIKKEKQVVVKKVEVFKN